MIFFILAAVSTEALGPTQPPIQWVQEQVSLPRGQKWPEHEADHSPPSSALVKKKCKYTFTPTIRHHGVVFN
jgi:hypothetical protein